MTRNTIFMFVVVLVGTGLIGLIARVIDGILARSMVMGKDELSFSSERFKAVNVFVESRSKKRKVPLARICPILITCVLPVA